MESDTVDVDLQSSVDSAAECDDDDVVDERVVVVEFDGIDFDIDIVLLRIRVRVRTVEPLELEMVISNHRQLSNVLPYVE